ncbi:MAG: D-alanyl-lipoteichoic acid biosynthesis protein DltD [Clostridia bacterium]|nr:D-alanyl-lipoteichoic acid biosynthesis protein DltD [Clostridia bacterium]
MKKTLAVGAVLLVLALALPFVALGIARGEVPEYRNAVGFGTDQNKIQGCLLTQLSAAREDNVLIYGSSELRTDYISTHPSNFFAYRQGGFQVNLIGRGSCQSIIHAFSIAANGESLRGKKVVLITSPQSFVSGGITPDMFAANFSQQQFLRIMQGDLPEELKAVFAQRTQTLLEQYETQFGTRAPATQAAHTLANLYNKGSQAAMFFLSPYFRLSSVLAETADAVQASRVLAQTAEDQPAQVTDIDWQQARQEAVETAKRESNNNDFGIENGYYNTYIGSRLPRMKGKDSHLSYSESVEYDDLRLLFEVCRAYDITPLFVSVPLHGSWSDYCGFTAEKRAEYYQKVRAVAEEYQVQVADFTAEEYTPYFLCDVMHLGWVGWLEVNRAICDFVG